MLRRHVLEVHRQATDAGAADEEEVRREAFLKRYLEYARARVAPRLSEQAAEGLAGQYVQLRQEVRHFMYSVLCQSVHKAGVCGQYTTAGSLWLPRCR